MATANGNNSQLMERMAGGNSPASQRQDIKALLNSVSVKKRFEDILGKHAPAFMSSIISVANGNDQLRRVSQENPMSIISSAAVAAALNLPVDPNLGFAYIVPYGSAATFQMGYKGFIQLAMRTGQYKGLNACEVYEGEIKTINRFTGEIEFGEQIGDKVVGYLAYFKLLNGFEKYLYMSKEQIEKHAKTFSKSFNNPKGRWALDFHAMALKTVIKLLLSKYGILSVEMQNGMGTALVADGAAVTESGEYQQVDAIDVEGSAVDAETGEINGTGE
jgi:recombination protein RecT